jgi:hypothetical protein
MFVRKIQGLALLLPAILFALPSLAASAQQPVLPERFGAWSLPERQEISGAGLSGALGENFPIFVESGLVSAERGAYSRSNDSAPSAIHAILYRFRDVNGAYAGYTFLRTADMSSTDLTEKSAVGRERILAVIGDLLLDLSGPGAASLSELKSLVSLIQQQTSPGSYPTLWQYLPGQGFERTSDHYLLGPAALDRVFPLEHGDWLGIGQGAEAESARYHLGRDSITLLIAVYPTPQLARVKLQELASKFSVQVLDIETPSAGVTASAGSSSLYGQRRGLMVALVSGAHDARTARTLLDRIGYETSVTWNEPSWEAKEPPFLVMIVNILIGTALMLLYALIAGLLFAGVRLLVKRMAPGRFFDRDEDVELIQLGLGSKPIEAKDFLSLRPPE